MFAGNSQEIRRSPVESRRVNLRSSPERAGTQEADEAVAAVNAREKAALGLPDKPKHYLDRIKSTSENEASLREAADIEAEINTASSSLHEKMANAHQELKRANEEFRQAWHKQKWDKYAKAKEPKETPIRVPENKLKKKINSPKTKSDILQDKFQADFKKDWDKEVVAVEANEQQEKLEKEWLNTKQKETGFDVAREGVEVMKKTEKMKKQFLAELKTARLDKETIAAASSLFSDLHSSTASAETIAGSMNILAARGVDQKNLDDVHNFIKENFPAMLPGSEILHSSEAKIGDAGLEQEWAEASSERSVIEGKKVKQLWLETFDDLEKKFMAEPSKEGGSVAVARAILAAGKNREEIIEAAQKYRPQFLKKYLPENWDFDRAKVEIPIKTKSSPPNRQPTTIFAAIKNSWKKLRGK